MNTALAILTISVLSNIAFADDSTTSKDINAIRAECQNYQTAYDSLTCTAKYLDEATKKLNSAIKYINDEFQDPRMANDTNDIFKKYINIICATDQSMGAREARLYNSASEMMCKIEHIQLRTKYLLTHYCNENGCPIRKVTP